MLVCVHTHLAKVGYTYKSTVFCRFQSLSTEPLLRLTNCHLKMMTINYSKATDISYSIGRIAHLWLYLFSISFLTDILGTRLTLPLFQDIRGLFLVGFHFGSSFPIFINNDILPFAFFKLKGTAIPYKAP